MARLSAFLLSFEASLSKEEAAGLLLTLVGVFPAIGVVVTVFPLEEVLPPLKEDLPLEADDDGGEELPPLKEDLLLEEEELEPPLKEDLLLEEEEEPPPKEDLFGEEELLDELPPKADLLLELEELLDLLPCDEPPEKDDLPLLELLPPEKDDFPLDEEEPPENDDRPDELLLPPENEDRPDDDDEPEEKEDRPLDEDEEPPENDDRPLEEEEELLPPRCASTSVGSNCKSNKQTANGAKNFLIMLSSTCG